MIEENCREVRNDLVGLNIWWNLSILRDTYEGRWTNHDSKIQQKGKAVSCRFHERLSKKYLEIEIMFYKQKRSSQNGLQSTIVGSAGVNMQAQN